MIENTIYSRLTLTPSLTDRVAGRIYPTIPAENVPELPFVVYRVSNTEPQLHTQGVSSITKYTVEIDSYGKNMADATEVMGAARTALHGFRGGEIQGAFLSSQSTEEIEEGYHGQQAFTVWASAANVVATSDSTAKIETGNSYIKLTGNQLGFFGSNPVNQPVFNGDWLSSLDAPIRMGFDQLLAGLFALGLFRDELA